MWFNTILALLTNTILNCIFWNDHVYFTTTLELENLGSFKNILLFMDTIRPIETLQILNSGRNGQY